MIVLQTAGMPLRRIRVDFLIGKPGSKTVELVHQTQTKSGLGSY
jgi:hypothetical protein